MWLGSFQKDERWAPGPLCISTEIVPWVRDCFFVFTCAAVEHFVIISANVAGEKELIKTSIVLLQ